MGHLSRLKVLFGSKKRKKQPDAKRTATTGSTTLSVQSTLVQLSPQNTTSSSVDNASYDDLWAEAFRKFEARESDLAADYTRHLKAFHNSGSNNSGGSTNFLSNATSAEALMRGLLADREKKQWRVPLLEKDVKIRAQIEKLTKFCLYTDEIVKQAFSAQPHAAMAWSGVSILLPLITSGKVQHDAMLAGFEYIGDIQMYWKIYEEGNRINVDPRHKEIREALVKLYSYIVEYQARVICHLSSAQLSRTWQKVADLNDWDGRKQGIAELDAHCCRLVSESDKVRIERQRDLQLQEIQESRTILSEIRKGLQDLENQAVSRYNDAMESALLRDLSSDYEHYKNINPLRVQGTCEWLFNDANFRKWRASTESSILWVSAGPGCGKSVLTRCLTGVEGQMDSASGLTGILHQLFVQDSTGDLIKHGLASHRNHGDKLRHNFAELWRVLLASAKSYPSGDIICVLDALDECSEETREKFLLALDNFFTVEAHRCRLKFLITSRPYDDLEAAFKRHTKRSSYLRVDGDDKVMEIGREINFVIDIKVEEFTEDFSENHRKILSERLKAMDNRTYLWLHLTFDIIKKRRSFFSKASRIQDLLNSVPTRVSEAYETILNHTSDDLDDQLMTKGLLEIILAATRPLTLEEANHALTLRVAKGDFPSQVAINDELWPKEGFKTVVKNLSGLFITVCDSRLSFIHLTAREFLTDTNKQGKWHGRFPVQQSHATMSISCIRYLSAVDPGTLHGELEIVGKDFPFLPYALTNWSSHYNSQHDAGRQNLCESARKLCDTSEGRGNQLVQMYCQSNTMFWVMEEESDYTQLNLACGLGLTPVVRQILNGLNMDPGYAEIYFRAISAAAWQGNADVVRCLLESTSDNEAHKQGDSMALTAVLSSYHLDKLRQFEVVKTILDGNSNNIQILDEEAISCAMYMGGRALVSLLLERLGDQIHFSDDVLEKAISNPDDGAEVVELLLDQRGDEVHTSENILMAAAYNYRSAAQVLAVLLKRRGAEVQITEKILVQAAENQECGSDIFALLLEQRGESIRITDNVVTAAAKNPGCALDMLKLLFQQRGDEIEITETLAEAVVGSRKFGNQLLKFILDTRGHNSISITASILEEAAGNLGCGTQVTTMLLDIAGAINVPVTAKAIENAAENRFQGHEILSCIFGKLGSGLPITERAFEKAAENMQRGAEVMDLLLGAVDDGVPITAQTIELAARNSESGKGILEHILKKRGNGIPITAKALEKAAHNSGPEVMSMLLDAVGDRVPITSEAVMNAAKNRKRGKELMELLLQRRPEEVRVTDEVLAAAARNEGCAEEIKAILLRKRDDDMKINEST
ncbi:Vegetative incompatibility HET-E-1-like protein [Cladobotryum mycophilum]|uniref:Vegetative incompatibility HET-E-1-like protein n=1 Tax=Cladobotryum mycophilum TaxID=491253 RepID=A0ABR0SN59_9HYPO